MSRLTLSIERSVGYVAFAEVLYGSGVSVGGLGGKEWEERMDNREKKKDRINVNV